MKALANLLIVVLTTFSIIGLSVIRGETITIEVNLPAVEVGDSFTVNAQWTWEDWETSPGAPYHWEPRYVEIYMEPNWLVVDPSPPPYTDYEVVQGIALSDTGWRDGDTFFWEGIFRAINPGVAKNLVVLQMGLYWNDTGEFVSDSDTWHETNYEFTANVVPKQVSEPATIYCLGISLVGLAVAGRKKSHKKPKDRSAHGII